MPVTERLMQPGSFSLGFEDVPLDVRNTVVEFGHIVVMPTPINPLGPSDSTIQSLARYIGVVTRPTYGDATLTVDGAGLAWWLGVDQGYGDLLDAAVTKTSGTLSAWITDLVPSAIAVGTVTNTSTSNVTWSAPAYTTRREAIDYVCKMAGAEWRILNTFAIDAAVAATLYNTTPTTVVLRKEGGQDLAYTGLEVASIGVARDATQFTTKVFAAASGAGPTVLVGSSTNATSYKDGRGNALVLERVIDAPTTDGTTNANTLAAAALAQYSTVKQPVTLSTKTYDIHAYVKPGDYLYVHDPRAGLVDLNNQVMFRGQVRNPVSLRVLSYTWPVEAGMSVYYRDLNGAYTDLTPWLAEESGDVTYEVGDYVNPASAPNLSPASSPVTTRLTTATRIGTTLRRVATQSIGSGVQANISWDTEDVDTNGFIAVTADTVTIPSGLDGIYSISARMESTATLTSGIVYMTVAGENYASQWIAGGSYGSLTVVAPLLGTSTIVVIVFNGAAASRNFTGRLSVYRIADF